MSLAVVHGGVVESGTAALRRMIREEHDSHWGMGKDEKSLTHSGEDYTGHAGDES